MEKFCEIIGREKIKPSSKTPPENKIYNLSWFDQVSHRSFIPILFFFNKPLNYTVSQTSHLLKSSLSQTLSNYYPFAGRIRDRESILCDDDGVDFLEARVKTHLSSILESPKKYSATLDELFPDNLQWRYPETLASPLLTVQVNYFDCGGLAVAVCLSHKIADAATLVSFVDSWASVARNSGDLSVISPPLNAAEIFPRGDLPLFPEPTCHPTQEICTTRRFVFEGSKIAELKRVTRCGSRVEALTSLLFKSAVKASEKIGSGIIISSHVLRQQVNLRARTVPKLPENVVGNMVWFFPVAAPVDGSQMREALTEFSLRYFERFRGDIDVQGWCLAVKECLEKSKSSNASNKDVGQVLSYVCTSWCRFPVYGIDFGWGDPVWSTTAGTVDKNVFILMETKCGDGIEAIVTLEEKEMSVFECDQELLQFAFCMA